MSHHCPYLSLSQISRHLLCRNIVCHARGSKGVALTDALDSRAACPTLPQYGSPEYDDMFLDRLHASIPALLSASAAEDMQGAAETVPETLELWQKRHMFVPTFQEPV